MKLSGIVHWSPLGASQFAIDSDWIVYVIAFGVVCAKNGCRNVWFTFAALSSPSTDQSWFASTPDVRVPFCLSATTVGPIAHFGPLRGSNSAGPAPQIQLVERTGEKNSENVMSPATVLPGVLTVGMTSRAIMFVCSAIWNGTTGWMFMMWCMSSFGP